MLYDKNRDFQVKIILLVVYSDITVFIFKEYQYRRSGTHSSVSDPDSVRSVDLRIRNPDPGGQK
jgi:hypothetical protein